MNQRGDVFSGIMIFVGALVILGLYVVVIEPLIQSSIANSPVNGQGTDTYLIIMSAGVMIMLFAIHRLIKSPDSLTFGGG